MKKFLFLITTVLMTLATYAQSFQGFIPDGTVDSVYAEETYDDGVKVLKLAVPSSAVNEWDAKLITPNWQGLDGQEEGASFCLSFDYKGTADGGHIRIASGCTYPLDVNYNQGTNTQIVNDLGTPIVYGNNLDVTTDWTNFEYDLYIGAEGADSIRLEIDCGAAGGDILFKNFSLKIKEKEVAQYYMGKNKVNTQSFQGFIPDGTDVYAEETYDNDVKVLKLAVPSSAYDCWDAQLVTPSWQGLDGQEEGASFCLSFDYKGSADGGYIRIASGRAYPWDGNYNQGANTQIVDDLGTSVPYDYNRDVTTDWTHFEYDYYIGAEGADSIRLEIDCGAAGGDILFKNFSLKIKEKEVAQYYMKKNKVNAQSFRGFIPDGTVDSVYAEETYDDDVKVLKLAVPSSAVNEWDAQLITPSWHGLDGQEEGASFCLSFDYKGSADGGHIRIASGRTYPWDANYIQGGNTQIVDDLGTPIVYDMNREVTTDWMTFEYDYYIGAEGADSIRLEIDCGAAGGDILFKNFSLKIKEKEVAQYYMEKNKVNAQFFQGFIPDGTDVYAEETYDDDLKVLKLAVPSSAANEWEAQLITPSWQGLDGQEEGASFCLSFDYKGTADGGHIRIASGRTYPWDANYIQGGNTQIVDDLGTPIVYDMNREVTTDWMTFEYDYYIGAEGADSIRLEIDCGAAGGDILFKNFVLALYGDVVAQYYNYEEEEKDYLIYETAPDYKATVTGVTIDKDFLYSIYIPATTTIDGKIYDVTNISDNAFAGCTELKTIYFEEATEFSGNAFSECEKLTTIVCSGSAKEAMKKNFPNAEIRTNTEIKADFKYDENNPTTTISDYIGNGGNVIIPYGIRIIGEYAFSYNSAIKSVTIPNSVTSIGSNAA